MRGHALRWAGLRPLFVVLGLILALSSASVVKLEAQETVQGQNVNVTGGPAYLTLDPFEIVGNPWRNQEVEGHCAVSSRNPAVIVCSGVDYRLVDLPGITEGVHNDSWNMFAQSIDSGLTWVSRLVPGHPLDPEPNILSDYDFAADPIVQAGAAGLFYHAGLVADRPEPGQPPPPSAPGAIYVSTWMHLSDQEDDVEPVKLVQNGISIPAFGNSSQFRDRPHLAVGEPNGRTCTLNVPRGEEMVTQTIPATPAYLAFTTFVGAGKKVKTQIHFMKSDDCGQSWTKILKVSKASTTINVGVQVVKFPGSPRILLFWRRGAQEGESDDAIMVTRSDDEGETFIKPRVYAEICPYDQDTSPTTFRHRTVPSAWADADRAYVAWAERLRDLVTGECTSDGTLNDARVVVSATTNGVSKTAPMAVDPYAGRGHQLFPTLAVAANRVHVSWLDFRNDASGVFQEFVDELPIVENDPDVLPEGSRNRHTADMFAAEADAEVNLEFEQSQQISQYIHGITDETLELEQLQWNVVNARNFNKMRDPFFGDFNDTTTEAIVPVDPVSQPGAWTVNGAPDSPPFTPVFHRFWTDGRNVQLRHDEDYTLPRPYTPPDLTTAILGDVLLPETLFDPTQERLLCDPESSGTKNIEIYTSRSTHGFYAFAPWNNKAMLTLEGDSVQRAFVVVVQNTNPPPSYPSPAQRTRFRLTIVNQPLGETDLIPERASFEQFSVNPANGSTIPAESPVVQEELVVRAGSAIARTVYVTSSDPRAAVRVDVEKLDSDGTTVLATRAVFLNPDPSAPPNLKQPETDDGTQENFDIERFEVHGIEIGDADDPNTVQDIGIGEGVPYQGVEDDSVDWGTPRWQNPRWQNPRWQNPRWQNPRWQNPRWQNPRWQNPRWQNVAVSDEDAEEGSRHIRTQITNTGNTTSAYDARVLVNTETSDDFSYQLVVYKLYTSTPMEGCEAGQVGYTQVLVNIPDYDASFANFNVPADESETTFSLYPGETAFVELVVFGTLANPPTNFEPTDTTVFKTTPLAVDTVDVVPGLPVPDPEPVFSQLFIVDSALPDGTVGQLYPVTTLQADGGEPPYSWSLVAPSNFPAGLMLDANTGDIFGTPTVSGTFDFTVEVDDSAFETDTHAFSITVLPPPGSSLNFNVQPSVTTGGETMPTVVVQALDNVGAALPGISITMAVGTNPCSASTMTGGTVASTDGTGIATFGSLSIDKGGWNYTLVASATGTPAINVTSDPFNVVGFCDTGSLSIGRTEIPATLLPNGKVLFAGGTIAFDTETDTAELFDPAGNGGAGSFSPTGPLSDMRTRHAATLLTNGQVLITGGQDNSGALASAELFDPAGAGSFSPTASMVLPRTFPTATRLLNGEVLVVEGFASPNWELFDSAGNLSGTSGDLITARSGHTASLLPDGKVLVVGGVNGSVGPGSILASAELHDPATHTFSPTFGSMSTARFWHASTPLPNGKVLVSGGADPLGSFLASAELYDPATDTFSPTGSMGTARSLHVATMLPSGKVLISGGVNGSPPLASAELYDPATGTFSPAGNMGIERYGHSSTVLPDGTVLIGGGQRTGVILADAEIFYPDSSFTAYVITAIGGRAIDTNTGAIVAMIPGVGMSPKKVAVTPDGTHAYVTDSQSPGFVYVVDTATNTSVGSVAVGDSPRGLDVHPDGSRVYVANEASGNVSVIDTAFNTVVTTIAVGGFPQDVVVAPGGARAYVTNFAGGVSVIDTASNTVLGMVGGATCCGPSQGAAITPDGSRLYVTNVALDSVSVIDTVTNTELTTVAVGDEPRAVAISPDGGRAYVVNHQTETVSVLDTATDTVLATIPVGQAPIDVAVTPDGVRVIVANQNSGDLSIIATASNTVLDTIMVGTTPSGVAIAPPKGSTTVDLTTGATGTTVNNQSFNGETRGVYVTVLSPSDLQVESMTLKGISIQDPGGGTVGARMYSGSGALIASANTLVSPGTDRVVNIPISATLQASSSYRLAFFVTVGTPGNTGDMFDPAPPGLGTTPTYTESQGLLRVNEAFQISGDAFPTTTNIFVPMITFNVLTQ